MLSERGLGRRQQSAGRYFDLEGADVACERFGRCSAPADKCERSNEQLADGPRKHGSRACANSRWIHMRLEQARLPRAERADKVGGALGSFLPCFRGIRPGDCMGEDAIADCGAHGRTPSPPATLRREKGQAACGQLRLKTERALRLAPAPELSCLDRWPAVFLVLAFPAGCFANAEHGTVMDSGVRSVCFSWLFIGFRFRRR